MLTENDRKFLKEHFVFGVVGCFHRFEEGELGVQVCKKCGKYRRAYESTNRANTN